jgi:hypothetical protein
MKRGKTTEPAPIIRRMNLAADKDYLREEKRCFGNLESQRLSQPPDSFQ